MQLWRSETPGGYVPVDQASFGRPLRETCDCCPDRNRTGSITPLRCGCCGLFRNRKLQINLSLRNHRPAILLKRLSTQTKFPGDQ